MTLTNSDQIATLQNIARYPETNAMAKKNTAHMIVTDRVYVISSSDRLGRIATAILVTTGVLFRLRENVNKKNSVR